MTNLPTTSPEASPPWWTFGHVWLVLSGPLVVVVASFITLYLAVTRPDPVVSEDYDQQGLSINQQRGDGRDASLAPALQARNHAATGRVPDARPATKP
jgi:hypothetical protein